jgi:hypothetical protein
MRLFFLAQRVGLQDVAGPLPHVVQPLQHPAQRVLGGPQAGGDREGFLQQGHRPGGVREAEVLGGEPQEGIEQAFMVLVQQRGAPAPPVILERRRVQGPGILLDPEVDALAGDTEHAGDVGGGAAAVVLEDSEGTAEEAGVHGLLELATEALPLPGSQVQPAHGLLLHCRRDS